MKPLHVKQLVSQSFKTVMSVLNNPDETSMPVPANILIISI